MHLIDVWRAVFIAYICCGCPCSLLALFLCSSLSILYHVSLVFFFSSRRRHTRLQGDWSSDVCSSDLACRLQGPSARAHLGLSERRGLGLARLPHQRKSRLAPVHGFLFQKQGERLPRPGRARQSLASLERNAAVQGDGNNAL